MPPRKRALDVKVFKQKLLEERARYEAQLSAIESRTARKDRLDAAVEEQDFDDAPGDAAMETLSRGTEMALEENTRDLVAAIDLALRKIEKGTYGSCDSCGKPIKKERLERLPSATMCLECQAQLER